MGLPDWLPGRPGGDPQRLRDMARAWDALDTALGDSERRLRPHADYVYDWWRGRAAEAYTSAWLQYSLALPSMHTSITTMSEHLRDAAQKIQDAQDQYDHYAEIAMGVAAAGLVLTVFTLGISDLAAAGGESGIIAACTALIETLAAALSAIGDFIVGC
jgi:WXG100 family type VII secretion target